MPIKYNSTVIAVTWVATAIPPEFRYERPILAYVVHIWTYRTNNRINSNDNNRK